MHGALDFIEMEFRALHALCVEQALEIKRLKKLLGIDDEKQKGNRGRKEADGPRQADGMPRVPVPDTVP